MTAQLPTAPLEAVTASTSLWAVPWMLLLLIVAVLATAAYLLRDRWRPERSAAPGPAGSDADGTDPDDGGGGGDDDEAAAAVTDVTTGASPTEPAADTPAPA